MRRRGAARPRFFAASEGSADVIEAFEGTFSKTPRALRRHRFDEAWLLPNSFRSRPARAFSRAPASGSATTPTGGAPADARGGAASRDLHQLRDYDRLLASRGSIPTSTLRGSPFHGGAAAGGRRAGARGTHRGRIRFVLLAPGAAFAWTKRWPPERFGRLAALCSRRTGRSSALAIGPGEEAIAAAVNARRPRPLPVLGADLDPVELAAVLARARVVVANDSGPMHLAAAVGTPVVALFGPTDPGRTGALRSARPRSSTATSSARPAS